jgi:3-dehydroquinate synthase
VNLHRTGDTFLRHINVNVATKREKYVIHIGYETFSNLARMIKRYRYATRYAVITDSKVRPLQGENLIACLRKEGIDSELFDFPQGEFHKTHETKLGLDMQLLDRRFGRDSAVIALGGGVVGDVAGFVAATYLRGIPCIQIPTTVIAQADSSIGGKTGIDYPQGKNLIGAFHHPVAVFIDPRTLATLDTRNYRSGLMEVLKHGLIMDRAFFDYFVRSVQKIVDRTHEDYDAVMIELMTKNSAIKNKIVSADPKEKNLRKILNYGHTVGHAVEHLSGYSLLHGEALAIGIACEAYFSFALRLCPKKDFEHQLHIIEALGLKASIPEGMVTDRIIDVMGSDKKVAGKTIQCVLLRKIGAIRKAAGGSCVHPMDVDTLRKLIDEYRSLNSAGGAV